MQIYDIRPSRGKQWHHTQFWQSGLNPDYCHPSVYVTMTTEETNLDQDHIHVINCRAEVHQTWTDFKHSLVGLLTGHLFSLFLLACKCDVMLALRA